MAESQSGGMVADFRHLVSGDNLRRVVLLYCSSDVGSLAVQHFNRSDVRSDLDNLV